MQLYLNCLSNIECKDISPNCKANLDKCPTNGPTKSSTNVFVETNCQKSCGICGNWYYSVLLNQFGILFYDRCKIKRNPIFFSLQERIMILQTILRLEDGQSQLSLMVRKKICPSIKLFLSCLPQKPKIM